MFFNEELCPNVCYCAGSDELNNKGESSKDSKSSKTSEGWTTEIFVDEKGVKNIVHVPPRLAQLQKEFGKEEGRKKYDAFKRLEEELENNSPWGDSKKVEKKDYSDPLSTDESNEGWVDIF